MNEFPVLAKHRLENRSSNFRTIFKKKINTTTAGHKPPQVIVTGNAISIAETPRKTGVYINAKFAINLHYSYKKNLGIKSLCIFYKPRI